MIVQILQALQYLPGPLLQRLNGYVPVLLPVVPQIPRRAHLSDEIQSVGLIVGPHMIQLNDVLVLQRTEQPDFREEAVDHRTVLAEFHQTDLVPGHFNPFLLIKSAVNFLHRTETKHIAVSAVSTGRIDLFEGFSVLVGQIRVHARHLMILK